MRGSEPAGGSGFLLFAVPLRSRRSSKSWERVARLLERTLRSICAQTSPRFAVVVACHERPTLDFDHPALRFLEVDLPEPRDLAESHLDKKVKMRLALQHGRDLPATHGMVVDADDCVSRRLAAHVARHPRADGWFLRSGFFHSERSGSLHLRRGDFHRWTGTSHIVRLGLFRPMEGLCARELARPETLAETWYVGHVDARAEVRRRGGRLQPLPFPGAVYQIEHGENLGTIGESMYRRPGLLHRAKRALFNDRRLDDRLRREFGLYELAEPPPPRT